MKTHLSEWKCFKKVHWTPFKKTLEDFSLLNVKIIWFQKFSHNEIVADSSLQISRIKWQFIEFSFLGDDIVL
jgi:hypothetical protein